MIRLAVALSAASLVAMILIDRAMGARAEFLNAWSVFERLLGRPATSGDSVVATHLGAFGELCVVLVVNATIGTLLAVCVRLAMRLVR
jgi:hypothetical protein